VQFVQVDNPPGNPKLFTVEAQVDGKACGRGSDFNKKSAEKIAAEKAMEHLKATDDGI